MAHKNLTPLGLTSLVTTSHTPIMTFINTSSHILSKVMLSRWSSAFLSQNTARWQLADPSGTPRYHYCRRAIVPRSDFKGPHHILMHLMMNQLCTTCLRIGLTREKGIAPSTRTKLQFLRRISHLWYTALWFGKVCRSFARQRSALLVFPKMDLALVPC